MGDVGYLIIGIKDVCEVKVGDIIIDFKIFIINMIEGFEDVKFMVFVGIYFVDIEDYEELRSFMEKF